MKYIMLLVAVFMFAAGAALCYFGHTGSGATIAIGAMITMTIVFGVIEANREARERGSRRQMRRLRTWNVSS